MALFWVRSRALILLKRLRMRTLVSARLRTLKVFLQSFKAASGDTYVRVESFGDAGQQGSESTYMDASGKVLGYANSNSYSYDDGSGKTVTNTSVNYTVMTVSHLVARRQMLTAYALTLLRLLIIAKT